MVARSICYCEVGSRSRMHIGARKCSGAVSATIHAELGCGDGSVLVAKGLLR